MFSAEQITPGHPDKACDQISDALLDAYLAQDPLTRAGIETFAKDETIVLGGEVSSTANIDVQQVVKDTLKRIGYVEPWYPLEKVKIQNLISQQSPDIAMGVAGDEGKADDIGAGDQGIMFGYATDDNEEMLPKAYLLATKLAQELYRSLSSRDDFGPDGKTQVTLDENFDVENVIVSIQHSEDLELDEVRKLVKSEVIEKVLPGTTADLFLNQTGRFVIGGPLADAGLTGRKIVADQFGPGVPVGGGAFSGKDPTKVDRSAAYMCRYIAKHLVKAGLAKQCLIQVAYVIGKAEPTDIYVHAYGTGDDKKLTALVKEHFSFSPKKIIDTLNLRRPIYFPSASMGHYAHDTLPWEQIDPELVRKLS